MGNNQQPHPCPGHVVKCGRCKGSGTYGFDTCDVCKGVGSVLLK